MLKTKPRHSAFSLQPSAFAGPLLALFAGGVAAWPLTRSGFYEGHDGLAHLYRVAILAEDIQRGIVYPRWAADLALGYGYPVMHFYGPGAHYLAWAISLPGIALPEAVKLAYAVGLLLAALGACLLTRAVVPSSGWAGAALGGAAYALAPYLLDDVYVRGAFGESISFGLVPFLFVGVHRLMRGAKRSGVAITATTTASLIVTYNPIALFAIPLAGLWGLGSGGQGGRGREGTRARGREGKALTPTLSLTREREHDGDGSASKDETAAATRSRSGDRSYERDHQPSAFNPQPATPLPPSAFRLPPFFSLFTLHSSLFLGLALAAWFWLPALVDSSVVTIGNLGYARENFLRPDQLVQAELRHRHELFPFSLGLVQVTFAAIGAIGLVFLKGSERRRALFFPVAGLALATAITSPAAPIWETVPFLTLIAYPWRLLGLISLCLAVTTAGLLPLIGTRLGGRPSAGDPVFWTVALGVVAALTWASLSPTLPDPIPVQARDITPAGWLRREYNLGILGTTTGSEYLPKWATRGPGAAADVPRDTGAGAIRSARLERVSGNDIDLTIETRAPVDLRLHGFAFPGWTARIDGQPALSGPSTALGLLTSQVPAGRHRVEFRFEQTPLTATGIVIGVVAACLLIGLLLWRAPGSIRFATLSLAALLAAVAHQVSTPTLSTYPIGRELAPGLWLLGATTDARSDELAARLYWLATRPTESDFRTLIQFVDETDRVIASRDAIPRYSTEPTSEWRVNEVIVDPVWLPYPADRPAGTYRLRMSLLERGRAIGSAEFGEFPLAASSVPPSPAAIAGFGRQISVVSADLRGVDRFNAPSRSSATLSVAHPGDEIVLALHWRALRIPDEDYVVTIQLFGADNRRWGQIDRRPSYGLSAMTTWHPDEIIKDEYRVVLPLDVPAGDLRVELGVYEPGGPRLRLDQDPQRDSFTIARFTVEPSSRNP